MKYCVGCDNVITKCECDTDDLLINFGMPEYQLKEVIHKAAARKKFKPGH